MALQSGTSLGNFQIEALIGAGGMGEVYRARDTKLGRSVAVKVLPEAFARDADRVARFEREARVVASLNHPNIAAIHGLEDANGVRSIIMELVLGETLEERLSGGPMPVTDAVPIFGQIAEALETAHEHGVVHRDLKPANIKITETGQAKILDFGLAKAFEGPVAPDTPAGGTLAVGSDAAGVTCEGRIMGTPAYMSPEQARGRKVDKRADIWAFGCCLYEALTGRRPFKGETATDLMVAILEREPDWTLLPANTPHRIRDLLWRCLQKDPRRRLRDIGDAWFEISQSGSDPSGAFAIPGPTVEPRAGKGRFAFAAAAFVLGAALTAGFFLSRPPKTAPAASAEARPVRRYSITLPETMPVAPSTIITDVTLALSPDGATLVYAANISGTRQLVQRPLGSFEAQPMAGTEGATFPFFSPDGQWIGFNVPSERKLKKVSIRGGPPAVICDATFPLGATWGKDDTIIFSSELAAGLRTVSAQGGEIKTLTSLDPPRGEVYHTAPNFFGDHSSIFFVVSSAADIEHSRLEILELATGERKVIAEKSGTARYLPSGHIMTVQMGAVLARKFDAAAREPRGPTIPITESRVSLPNLLPSQFAVSSAGTYVFVPVRPGTTPGRTLVWVDRTGKETPLAAPAAPYSHVALSPDGARVALHAENLQDVILHDLGGGSTITRFTFDAVSEAFPLWSAKGDRIYFASQQSGVWEIWSKSADGTGAAGPISEKPVVGLPWAIHPDGELLAFSFSSETSKGDIGVVSPSAPGELKLLLQDSSAETQPAFSPDGKWLAYSSDETGRDEIFVRPFPGLDGKWQISDKGGNSPKWGVDGKELFYRNGSKMMSVKIDATSMLRHGAPELLFEGPYYNFGSSHSYAVEAERFLMIRDSEGATEGAAPVLRTELSVIENWFTELGRLLPAGAPEKK